MTTTHVEMKRGPYRIHQARIVLGSHGYTVSALAEVAGMTPGGITRQLSGEVRLSDRVYGALIMLIGRRGAQEVINAIPSRIDLA